MQSAVLRLEKLETPEQKGLLSLKTVFMFVECDYVDVVPALNRRCSRVAMRKTCVGPATEN